MRFAVAAGHPLTAEAAARALQDGGTAVDACVAGALMACVAEPVLAGFFGGGFLIAAEDGRAPQVLDFFVRTPKRKRPAADWDLRAIEADFGGEVRQGFHIGAASIATPGLPAGLAEAHARLGRIPLSELARPAVEAAAQGVALSGFQAEVARVVAPILTASAEARALWQPDPDRPPAEGDRLVNPQLADVLETWAREGPRFATEGEAAQALLALTREGGHLTPEDLRAYAPRWRAPLRLEHRGAALFLNPAPALGGLLTGFGLEMLAALQPRPGPPRAEALARAFALTARARLRDGAEALLTPEALARWRKAAERPASVRGTTHVSAVDRRGMAAALTLSNGEGCGLIAPGLGVMPNNMLGEEDLLPEGLEAWTPDRRLASMMAPALIRWPDGRTAGLGSGGSNRIRSAMAAVLARLADGSEALDRAVAAPRVHAEGDPAAVDFEDRFPDDDRAALLAAFPEARPWPRDSLFFGGVHAVRRGPSGAVEAAADARREGAVRLG